ncbi:MAG: hypothetical protein EP314_08580, partial [Bacteroidetes bacterium]
MSRDNKRGPRLFNGFIASLNLLLLALLLLSYLAGSVSPATFWPLAFIGMAYPLLLLATLAFALYWLLNRHWFLFINVALVLVKWDYVQETVQFPKPSPQETETGIKVMSFNVRLFDRFNWIEGDATDQSIYQFVAAQKPDILCIQEYYADRRREKNPSERIMGTSELANIHFEANPNTTNNKLMNGAATFTKFPIIEKGTVFRSASNNNMGIYTDVVIDGDTIRIYNLHLQSIGLKDKDYVVIDEILNKQEVSDGKGGKDLLRFMRDGFIRRSEQAEVVAEHLRNCKYAVIVCGDFNDVPTSYAYQTISAGLKDSFSEKGSGFGATYVRVPFFRIDHILYDPFFESSDHRVHN